MTEYVVVPKVPTITNKMKARFIGEFSWTEDDPYYDEDGIEHDGEFTRVVPWDLCKTIFKQMYAEFVAAAPQPEQPAPIPADVRAAFERWASDDGKWPNSIERNGDHYLYTSTQEYWRAWQACTGLTRPAAPDSIATCEWREDADGIWETACGEAWQCTEGTPVENDMKYCHSCGKHLKEMPHAAPGGE